MLQRVTQCCVVSVARLYLVGGLRALKQADATSIPRYVVKRQ
jgi:hypothetical protein